MVPVSAISAWLCVIFCVIIFHVSAESKQLTRRSADHHLDTRDSNELIFNDLADADAYVKRGYVRIGKREAAAASADSSSSSSSVHEHKRRSARSVGELPVELVRLNPAELPNAEEVFGPRAARGAFMRFGRGGAGGEEGPAGLNYDDGFLRFGRGNFMRFGRR